MKGKSKLSFIARLIRYQKVVPSIIGEYVSSESCSIQVFGTILGKLIMICAL
jgi:hypothetical protein